MSGKHLNKEDGGSWFMCFGFLFKYLLMILPLCLFFSYHPVISLGGNESMNFELSLPLLWLVVFDVVAVVMMCERGVLFTGWRRKLAWVLFPVWLTLSVLWSLNPVRGVLTVGILWLIYLAVDGMWSLRDLCDEEFRRVWWKWFFGSSLLACAWCAIQCVLDLAGVSQDYTLMCDGCTYRMFGFPHPNGFAIELQFMGNLLLAPTMVGVWFVIKDDHNSILRGRGSSLPSSRGSDPSSLDQRSSAGRRLKTESKLSVCSAPTAVGRDFRIVLKVLLPIIFMMTLFLTFSRGAIYAFLVGMVMMSVMMVVGWREEWKVVLKRVGMTWGLVVVAFLFTLNLQGVMAAISPTSDTYMDGVAKVINHMSLGKIEIRGGGKQGFDDSSEDDSPRDGVIVENSVENSFDIEVTEAKEQSVFTGYVAESTNARLRLTGAAVEVWSQDFNKMAFGVGLGGAGWALYNNGLSPAPKEIVQNEYASLLLEAGVVGISLLVVSLVLVVRFVLKKCRGGAFLLLPLLVAYGVSLLFFSGLPNALQIYLMPGVLAAVLCGAKNH